MSCISEQSGNGFILGDQITFGLRPVQQKIKMEIPFIDHSEHYAFTQKLNEEEMKKRLHAAQTFCSTVPLSGTAELELQLVWNDDINLSGVGRDMSIGVVGWPKDHCDSTTVTAPVDTGSHSSTKVMWQRGNQLVSNLGSRKYGNVNLFRLRSGDRIGVQVKSNGELTFFIDGKSQGVAARNIYSKDHDLYVVVDVTNNDYALKITKAGNK